MKTCDEMVNSLLERRAQYAAEQKRKRKVLTRIVTSMCCVCLVTLLGFGMWQGGMFTLPPEQTPTVTPAPDTFAMWQNGMLTLPPEQTIDNALYSDIKDTFDENKGGPADNPTANNKIIVHSIKDISAARHNICLFVDDFIEMTVDEMKQYYGVDYVPDVPDDIKQWENHPGTSGIYRRNGGTGEVYWDTEILNYSNEGFTRNVHLEVVKDGLPLINCFYFRGTEEKSIINNVEVMIGQTESGYYYAEFLYHNVSFVIDADGVTQDEFVAIIASILE